MTNFQLLVRNFYIHTTMWFLLVPELVRFNMWPLFLPHLNHKLYSNSIQLYDHITMLVCHTLCLLKDVNSSSSFKTLMSLTNLCEFPQAGRYLPSLLHIFIALGNTSSLVLVVNVWFQLPLTHCVTYILASLSG